MITGSLILVDLTKFGYSRIIILSIKVVPSKMEQAIEYMKSVKGVGMCSEAIGSYNLVIWLFLKNIDEAQKIIADIKKLPYIIKVHTCIWTHVEKALIRPKNISLDKIVGSDV
jgi:DNA-binding Lrp family transcriptional regulator